jgi:hypothetical protein
VQVVLADSQRGGETSLEPLRPAGGVDESLVTVGIVIAALTVTVQSVGHVVGVRLLDDRYVHLNVDEELGLAAWTSAAVTFAAAFAVLLLTLLREAIDRWLVGLVALVAFFSLDDAVVVHERAAEKIAEALGYGDYAERLIWPILFGPLFLAALILLVHASRELPDRARGLVRIGIGLFVVALGTELLSSAVYSAADVEPGSWPDVFEVLVEESAELSGWILVATAFLAAVVAYLDEDHAAERRRGGT